VRSLPSLKTAPGRVQLPRRAAKESRARPGQRRCGRLAAFPGTPGTHGGSRLAGPAGGTREVNGGGSGCGISEDAGAARRPQTHQPRHRADGHRQGPHLQLALAAPDPPRTPSGTPAPARRLRPAPRNARRRGRDGTKPARTRRPRVYLPCTRDVTRARPACGAAGRDPSRRAVRSPLPASYISVLTCTVPPPGTQQVHERYTKGPQEVHRTSCNNRVVLPRQHQFPGSESKKALKTGFM
jgi:hypothetical protein